jgi:hypothetical protein
MFTKIFERFANLLFDLSGVPTRFPAGSSPAGDGVRDQGEDETAMATGPVKNFLYYL